ncbi:MAG: 3-phosphoshikimate 1-carboxyvinyltransferase [Candidatus Nanopelagicales bacterium]|nr:3-phosphoshikimate 1-carboxyvinyltransferase [Candidatus Nanopelagicales bacterium]
MPDLWNAPNRTNPVTARVRIPGSKSLTNRWLIMAAISSGECRINHPLQARDTLLMAQALSVLGSSVEIQDDAFIITPGESSESVQVDCGLAGTVMRFVPPVAALSSGNVRFDGDPHARVRPMKQIISALRNLDVEINDDGRGTLPFTVTGKGFVPGGTVTIDASESSQFVSALLLAGCRYDAGVTVVHSGAALPSMPHIDMSVEVLRELGIRVDVDVKDSKNASWTVHPGIPRSFNVTVEPDLSNAAPFLAAALVCGGSVTIPDWPQETTQAGDALVSLLPKMGAAVTRDGNDLTVTGGSEISGIDVDLHDVGELTPVIAALCALATGPSTLRGISHLRGHETDRLAALATEINKLGGNVTETADGLHIEPTKLHGGQFATYSDHRMAMAGAVLGLAIPDLVIEDIATTGKTLPNFAKMWQEMVSA